MPYHQNRKSGSRAARSGGSKHSGHFNRRGSRGISNGFRGSERQDHGVSTNVAGSRTQRPLWLKVAERRKAKKIVKQSRRVNRP